MAKHILILLGLLLIIFLIAIQITKLILTDASIEHQEVWLKSESYAIDKQLRSIKLYKNGLNECYKHQEKRGCGVIAEKLLQLKDDYNQRVTDYNKKAKKFNWQKCTDCKDIPRVYKIERSI